MKMYNEHAIAKVPKYALKLVGAISTAVSKTGTGLAIDQVSLLIGIAIGCLAGMTLMAVMYVLLVRLRLHVHIRHHFIRRQHASSQEPEAHFTQQETVINIFSETGRSTAFVHQQDMAKTGIHHSLGSSDDIIDMDYDQFDPLSQPTSKINAVLNDNNMFDAINSQPPI